MKTIKFVKSRKDCERGFLLPDGRIIVTVDKGGFLNWNTKFNLCTGEIADDPLNVSLNILNGNGLGREVACYDEYAVYPCTGRAGKGFFEGIAKEFKEHGFNVTEEALRHNYDAWRADLKSGYRDEENGYHLFTPCGCNPLSFRATLLEDRLDWQTTYEC